MLAPCISVALHAAAVGLLIAEAILLPPRLAPAPPEPSVEVLFEPVGTVPDEPAALLRPAPDTGIDVAPPAPTAEPGLDAPPERAPATGTQSAAEPDHPAGAPDAQTAVATAAEPHEPPTPAKRADTYTPPLPLPPAPPRTASPEPRVAATRRPPERHSATGRLQPDAAPARPSRQPAVASAQPALQPPSVTVPTPAWRAALAAWLQARKAYPEAARRQNVQGRVVVRFLIARDGAVSEVAVIQGSDHPILDEAALAMLRGAHGPTFTAGMEGDRIAVTVPVSFALTQ